LFLGKIKLRKVKPSGKIAAKPAVRAIKGFLAKIKISKTPTEKSRKILKKSKKD